MKPQETSPSPPPGSVSSLSGRLPKIPGDLARALRMVSDRRLPSWLATAFGPGVALARIDVSAGERLVLDFACMHGRLRFATDAGPWPALRLAGTLPESQRRPVAELLLHAVLTAAAGILPGLRLLDLHLDNPGTMARISAPGLVINGIPATLEGIDEAYWALVEGQLRQVPAPGSGAQSALRLPSRLHLFSRGLRWARLKSLGTGDVVLSGLMRQAHGRWPIALFFGTDPMMQTQASIGIDANATQIHVEAPLQRVAEPPLTRPPAEELPMGFDDLQVPVAFEIDSTMLSLGEIAALGPGAVIELDVALANARVRILSHGQILGSGQLMAVGDQLAVRIDRMGLGLSSVPTPRAAP